MMRSWRYNDGGRAKAGFSKQAGDCVVRAIAIATELPYAEVHNALYALAQDFPKRVRQKTRAKLLDRANPETGVYKEVYRYFLLETLGWSWVPCMAKGTGCLVHLRPQELPKGRIICRCSRHLVAAIDGIPQDTFNSTRNGTRCVYGYFRREYWDKKKHGIWTPPQRLASDERSC